MKHLILAIYNEKINSYKKEVLINWCSIEYWRQRTLIIEVIHDWISFEAKINNRNYCLIDSSNTKDIKSFVYYFKEAYKFTELYFEFEGNLYYYNRKSKYLYNLSLTWYWEYETI